MKNDEGKIDEVVLALLHLTTFRDGPSMRAWKGKTGQLWSVSTKPVILAIQKTRPSQ